MPRTFTHIPDPHFVQKSKKAENGGGSLPPVTPENEGDFLRVNDAGKIVTDKYPIERQTNVLYDENVTMEGYESLNLVEYTNADNFPNLIVVINGTTVEYSNEVYQYSDENTTIVLILSDNYIKAETGDYSASDININITEPLTTIDPLFAEGVEELSKNTIVNFTNVRVDAVQLIENPLINVYLTSQDILTLMGGNSVTKPVSGLDRLAPRTFLIIAVTPSILSLNLNMISGNQIIYSGILAVENSTAILSVSITPNGNLFEAVITATMITQ